MSNELNDPYYDPLAGMRSPGRYEVPPLVTASEILSGESSDGGPRSYRVEDVVDIVDEFSDSGNLSALEVEVDNLLINFNSLSSHFGATNIWINANTWVPRKTNGCRANSRELPINHTNWDELLFDATTNEFAQAVVILPNNYNNSTITSRFYWTASGAGDGTDDVIWGIQGRAFANHDALDTAFGNAQTVTDTLLALNDMHITSVTNAVTVAGTPAANTPILFQIYRNATASGDTYGHDAHLLGVEIIFN